jgi:predicted nuclease with TOPRIM domain
MPALDGILERLQEFMSRIAAQRHAEQLEFERRMTAIQKEREIRQKEKESPEMQIRSLQQRLQEINHEGVAEDSKIRQLEIERDAAAEKWERTRDKWKDEISPAITAIVRSSIHSAVYLDL